MAGKSFKRAIRHWFAAVVYGIVGNVFGWGGFASALLIGFLPRPDFLGVDDGKHWWITPSLNVLIAFIFVAIVHFFAIAPYRAWRMLHPFKVKIASGALDTAYPKHEFEPQRSAVMVKNVSYRPRSGCLLHVMKIADFDNQDRALPRFIEEFSINSGEIKIITFATWTRRNPPNSDSVSIVMSGPVGWGWGGNFVQLPCSAQNMSLRISAPDCDPIIISCCIWVENRELKAKILESEFDV